MLVWTDEIYLFYLCLYPVNMQTSKAQTSSDFFCLFCAVSYLRPITLLPTEFLLESILRRLMTVKYRNTNRMNMTAADATKMLNSMVPHNSHHDLSCQPVEWCAKWLHRTANTGTPVKFGTVLITDAACVRACITYHISIVLHLSNFLL